MIWAQHAIDLLQQGQIATITPTGHSMMPLIKSGENVTLEPLEQIEVGDIVLCKVKGSVYLHLVKAVKGSGISSKYQIGNNRGGINGWCGRQNIYGTATFVGLKTIRDSGPYRKMQREPRVYGYFVTAIHLKRKTAPIAEFPAVRRTLGFLTQYAEAEDYILSSERGSIYQGHYQYAVIEKIPEGIRTGTDPDRAPPVFFRWSDEKGCYEKLDKSPIEIVEAFRARSLILSFASVG